jgi:hypothetical protein
MADTPKNVFLKLPYGAKKRYLGDRSPFNKWVDLLLDSKQGNRPHIPTFAQKLLNRLSSEKVFHKSEATLLYENLRSIELDNGQVVSIRFDTYRAHDRGYMAVEVLDAPRSDAAILAAMTAAATDPIDTERLREALHCL